MKEILENDDRGRDVSLLLLLDQIVDPQNLGALIRSANFFGVHAVVLPKRRSSPLTPIVVKASAGAVEHTSLVQVHNLAQTIDTLKEKDFWIMGADESAGNTLNDMDFSVNTAIVIGGEGTGIRPLIKKKCDFLFQIPSRGAITSLNASVAGAIALFEATRQRNTVKINPSPPDL